MLSALRRWLLRPSLWVLIITITAYYDDTALNGAFVYDDAGSVKNNVVVNGQVPWTQVWTRDYWGTNMTEPASHKSFRPVTTSTFRLNWLWATSQQQDSDLNTAATSPAPSTYSFHVVNVILHGIVTALVTEAAAFVFVDDSSSSGDNDTIASTTAVLITGLVFGLHPVHVEAVSNITSRGELLMSFFFLTAFLVYANQICCLNNNNNNNNNTSRETTKSSSRFSTVKTTICIYIIPWLCMILSMFSKEQGATTLATLVLYDFIHTHDNVKNFVLRLVQRDAAAMAFLRRATILTLQSCLVAVWRYWLNGESSPDFIYNQNPAGFSQDRFTRIFSVSWVYCLYIFDAIFPVNLCPDWSGLSIDLIENVTDPRILGVLALWIFAAACAVSLLIGLPLSLRSAYHQESRHVVLLAFFAFLFSPFLLSSNLLVVVGLMKADRVIYLPLMGFCLLEALFFKKVFCDGCAEHGSNIKAPRRMPLSRKYLIGHLLIIIQLLLYTIKLHERNIAWSNSLRLWMSAYKVNSKSRHTIYNCGYELSLKKRYAEAEVVLRPIGSPRVEGPSNTFVYAMVLFNLGRCDEALDLIDDALAVVEEKRQTGGVRNSVSSLDRTKSNLLVAQAFCTPDLITAGGIMYNAVQVDPTNQYAVDQAMQVVKRVEAAKQMSGGQLEY